MAQGKKSFIAYTDWGDIFDELTDEEAGRLVKHLFEYVRDNDPEPRDKLTKMLFIQIEQSLKRDLKKYDKYIDKQKVNGAKGGRPKKNPTLSQKTQPFIDKPKKADSVNVSVSVNDNDNVNDINKKSKAFAPPSLIEIQEYCKERKNSVSAETFIDFYASKGWLVGKNKMKDWQASIRTWEKRETNGHKKNSGANKTAATSFNNETEKYDY